MKRRRDGEHRRDQEEGRGRVGEARKHKPEKPEKHCHDGPVAEGEAGLMGDRVLLIPGGLGSAGVAQMRPDRQRRVAKRDGADQPGSTRPDILTMQQGSRHRGRDDKHQRGIAEKPDEIHRIASHGSLLSVTFELHNAAFGNVKVTFSVAGHVAAPHGRCGMAEARLNAVA